MPPKYRARQPPARPGELLRDRWDRYPAKSTVDRPVLPEEPGRAIIVKTGRQASPGEAIKRWTLSPVGPGWIWLYLALGLDARGPPDQLDLA